MTSAEFAQEFASIPQRVAEGVQWLNAQDKEWFLKIDLFTLQMDNKCHCVLGQLYEDFDIGFSIIRYQKVVGIVNLDEPGQDMGFDLFSNNHNYSNHDDVDEDWYEKYKAKIDEYYISLQEQWVKIINYLRNKHAITCTGV